MCIEPNPDIPEACMHDGVGQGMLLGEYGSCGVRHNIARPSRNTNAAVRYMLVSVHKTPPNTSAAESAGLVAA